MRAVALGLIGALLGGHSLAAQQVIPDSVFRRSSPALVKYGKWALLAASFGMGVQAAHAHNDADDYFGELRDYCDPAPTRCDRASNGDYLDGQSEQIYQRSLSRDRASRRWLLGGEVALLGAAGLFIWELSRPKQPTKNIPFEPTVSQTADRTNLGLRVAF